MKPCRTAEGHSLKAKTDLDSLWQDALKSQLQFALGKAKLSLFPCEQELWVGSKMACSFGTPSWLLVNVREDAGVLHGSCCT